VIDVEVLFFFGALDKEQVCIGSSHPIMIDAVVEEKVIVESSDPKIKSAFYEGMIDHVYGGQARITKGGIIITGLGRGVIFFNVGDNGIDFLDEGRSPGFEIIEKEINLCRIGVLAYPCQFVGVGDPQGVGKDAGCVQFLCHCRETGYEKGNEEDKQNPDHRDINELFPKIVKIG
jgi:hypothetical protein